MIKEGSANISVNKYVFYNPKMAKLRDISVLFLRCFDLNSANALDATTATGIRGIRYALECGLRKATLLDASKLAYKNASLNVKKNKLKLTVLNKNVQEFTNTTKDSFDVIDLDPFGTPAPFVYDLLKVAKDKSIFMITATDTATLCGAQENACIRRYASKPLNNELCHEVSVRILMNYLAKSAAQFNFGIEPLLSIADMHYVRVFLILKHGAKFAVESVKSCGYGKFCNATRAFYFSKNEFDDKQNIEHKCKNNIGFGPVWLGNLYDKKITDKMLKMPHSEDVDLLLKNIQEEYDTPFFYSIDKVTRMLKIGSVSKLKVMALLNKKHTATCTQFDNNGIKTDAKQSDVVRAVKAAS